MIWYSPYTVQGVPIPDIRRNCRTTHWKLPWLLTTRWFWSEFIHFWSSRTTKITFASGNSSRSVCQSEFAGKSTEIFNVLGKYVFGKSYGWVDLRYSRNRCWYHQSTKTWTVPEVWPSTTQIKSWIRVNGALISVLSDKKDLPVQS